MNRGNKDSILLAVMDAERRERLRAVLTEAGHAVRAADAPEEAARCFRRDSTVCAVVDGAPMLAALQTADGEGVVVVFGDESDRLDLLRAGAFGVARDEEELEVVTVRALEHGRLSRGHRELQAQVDINEKLAMIGRLASGVAHELNNPLDGVRRYLRITQEGLGDESGELQEYLDRAQSGLSRMASIVRQLLTFSRNVTIENERENLRTMLDEVVRTLAPTGSAAPTVDLDNRYLDIPVPRVLFQVFVNLLKNALDAVEARGSRGSVRIEVASEQDQVFVNVRDNGEGIADEDLRRVFEPFFTTKEVGKGTGLGLPISARIVERCGGKIRIESTQGEGTTVRITLPMHAATPSERSLQGANQG
ncbi:MAG: HAMP domain-containing sensor histidine kinase [Planctomycetota bacterium]